MPEQELGLAWEDVFVSRAAGLRFEVLLVPALSVSGGKTEFGVLASDCPLVDLHLLGAATRQVPRDVAWAPVGRPLRGQGLLFT